MSNVNNGQVGRLNDLLVDAEQTPLAIVNAENDIVAANHQPWVMSQWYDSQRGIVDVQVQHIQSTATDVNSTLSEYNLQGLGSSICATRLKRLVEPSMIHVSTRDVPEKDHHQPSNAKHHPHPTYIPRSTREHTPPTTQRGNRRGNSYRREQPHYYRKEPS